MTTSAELGLWHRENLSRKKNSTFRVYFWIFYLLVCDVYAQFCVCVSLHVCRGQKTISGETMSYTLVKAGSLVACCVCWAIWPVSFQEFPVSISYTVIDTVKSQTCATTSRTHSSVSSLSELWRSNLRSSVKSRSKVFYPLIPLSSSSTLKF